MPDDEATILEWIVPAAIVFGIAALLAVLGVWALRRARRSPKARAAASAAREEAGASLVRLDDAVAELDLEIGLSGALYGGGAPTSLRRARLTAQRVRDTSFGEYRALSETDAVPDDLRRAAQRIAKRAEDALALIAKARTEHDGWVRENVSAASQVAAARERVARLRASMGDSDALVTELSSRFAQEEWDAAARAARSAATEIDEADRLLALAEANAKDPSRSALGQLADAERALRQAEGDARTLEEAHRLVTQAALAVPAEFEAARAAVRSALTTRVQLDTDAATRLGTELREIDRALTALEADAATRPTRTVDAIARLRDRLDFALGDAVTAQQRLRGARTALPGTLAAARGALARAETALAHARVGADARARLLSAQDELARARQESDPVAALDAARRARRDAEDAEALANHDRMPGA
jgi:hypothetical protein